MGHLYMGHGRTEVTARLLTCAVHWVTVAGQRRGAVDVQARDSLLLVSLRRSRLRGHRLCGRTDPLLQRHGEAGEFHVLILLQS